MRIKPTKYFYGVCKFCNKKLHSRDNFRCRPCYDVERRKSSISRFWKRVNKTNKCWIWTGTINFGGYGKIWVNGLSVSAHRYSWELQKGNIPPGKFVCHSCDNRACVNPNHLWIGTARNNIDDMLKKKRQIKGFAHWCAKLNWSDVVKIRSIWKSHKYSQFQIASMFNIKQPQVSSIVLNKSRRIS